jgi:ABC-2 type transport system ATP-binding protein
MADFLAAGSGPSMTVRSPQAAELAALLTARGAAVTRQDDGTLTVTGITPEAVGELARAHGLALTGLTAHQATLEDRYMELTRDTADYRAASGEPAAARKQGGS